MANIDNLNFQVILGDEDFKEKVKEDMELAKQLNVSLSALLDLKSKIKSSGITAKATNDAIREQKLATAISNRAAAEERLATAQTNRTAASERLARDAANRANAESRAATAALRNEEAQRRVEASVRRTNTAYSTQSRILGELKNMALGYFSIHGATKLVSSLVRVTGEFELQRTTLAAMLGDLNKAEQVITKIQGLAVESPFQFKELTTYAKQLSAFSVPAEELYETTKMLADISAGLGVGMDRIVLAYGQVRSAAFLRGQEVRQFTEAGIPILDELAKQFTELEGRAVSTGEVFDKISARLVPFEMVAKVFKDMTSEGGKFYNMQEVQAETLKGKISNLKDAYEMMLNEIGEANSDKLKAGVDMLRRLMNNWESIGAQLVDLIKLFGAYKAAVALLNISDKIAEFGGLAKAIKQTTIAQKLLNSALLTNPYIVVGTAITGVALAIHRHRKELYSTSAAQASYNERVKELSKIDNERKNKIQSLINTIQDETQATIEREAALLSLKDSYPKIFEQYDIESLKLADILSIKKQIAEEDAKQKKLSALGGIAAQRSRLKTLINRGAGESYKEAAVDELRIMEEDYLKNYVLPDIVSGFRKMTDEALKSALNEAYRKSQYDTRGIEVFDTVPTTQDFYKDLYAAIQSEIAKRQNIKEVDGWRKKVQDTLIKLSLNKDHSFGLWATDTTDSVSYVEELVKRYKELNQEIELISSFDTKQADNLKKNIEAIEAVAKALNIDLAALTQGRETADDASEDMLKAFETYKKFLDEWKNKDFSLSGKGVYFDLSKITRDLNNAFAKVDQKRLDTLEMFNKAQLGDEKAKAAVIEKYGEEIWNAYITNGSAAIDELVKKEKEAARLTAYEKSRDLADKYLAEMDVDLSGFEMKSTAQIKSVISNLESEIEKIEEKAGTALVGMFSNISEGEIDQKLYLEWQMFVELLEQLKKEAAEAQENLEEKNWRRGIKAAEQFSKSIQDIGEKLSSLGTNIENNALINLGDWLTNAGELSSSLVSNIKLLGEELKGVDLDNTSFKDLSDAAKGAVGGIISAVATFAYNEVVEVIESVYQHQEDLNKATSDYNAILAETQRQSHTGIFGTDEMALAEENLKILTEAQKRHNATLEEFNKVRFQQSGYKDSYKRGSLADVMTDISSQQGWDLYKENGELNIDALETYFEAYDDRLSRKQRRLIEKLIEEGKQVEDAAAKQTEYITGLFSNAADDIASSMVDAFIETGDAATDLGDIVGNIAKKMAADLIRSLYFKSILDKYEKDIEAVQGNDELSIEEKTSQSLALLNSALAEIEGLTPLINQTLAKLSPYWEGTGEESSQNLSEGIKGITEDTANLLASYLNAMRSDVSQMRTLQAQHLPIISAAMPTIMDHLAQINAHTYDTSQHTQQMLSELISLNGKIGDVISDGSNGSAIKVLM